MINQISRLLNDFESGFENIRWSKEEIAEYIDEAKYVILGSRPDDFVGIHEITLKAGSVQELPKGLERLVEFRGIKTKDGLIRVSEEKSKELIRVAKSWFQDNCKTSNPNEYKVESVEFDKSNKRIFYVYPPVPEGKEVIAVVKALSIGDDIEFDTRFKPAIIEWALYRGYGKDSESGHAQGLSQAHLTHFYAILKNIDMADEGLEERVDVKSKPR
ncbi:DUF6682 family protein [Taylorella asinigenitalis]|uniref:Putative phage protein n=1 Tax=Taylorella asinigenitalis (strain MCE3) TaxID=1008459 RepID=G4QCU8_TAYAM|nr:DUF6682 family protein [Taylorella asinigenitalis]AEP36228.1 putative phage protein [Taylorella asinigenitalis MCE3]